MKDKILSALPAECPWRDTLYWYDTAVSTNDLAKQMAKDGAAHGTVLVAGQQTGGRGRMGRSFHSADGGIYLSVILRPQCKAEQLMHLTCAVAVAVCDALEQTCGFRPQIKWINDLVAQGKKLGGILTELSLLPGGQAQYAIVGIGINCTQSAADFPPELCNIATTVRQILGKTPDRNALTASLIHHLCQISAQLLSSKHAIMRAYRNNCITLNKQVTVHAADGSYEGFALNVDDDGGLILQLADGSTNVVSAGEVSIRLQSGYV